jgi:hypothetical protein
VLKFHLTIDKCKQRVVGSATDIFSGMNVSSALPNYDVSGKNGLTV